MTQNATKVISHSTLHNIKVHDVLPGEIATHASLGVCDHDHHGGWLDRRHVDAKPRAEPEKRRWDPSLPVCQIYVIVNTSAWSVQGL